MPLSSKFQFTHPVRGATTAVPSTAHSVAFQFTHPVRGATRLYWIDDNGVKFQFTHPVRGATLGAEMGQYKG